MITNMNLYLIALVCMDYLSLVKMTSLSTSLVQCNKMRVKQSCSPWIHDADITVVWHQRDWLHYKALKSGMPEDWARYRKYRNK